MTTESDAIEDQLNTLPGDSIASIINTAIKQIVDARSEIQGDHDSFPVSGYESDMFFQQKEAVFRELGRCIIEELKIEDGRKPMTVEWSPDSGTFVTQRGDGDDTSL